MEMICPTHQVALVAPDDPAWIYKLRVCPFRSCGYNVLVSSKARQPKLPGLDPGIQYRQIEISEKEIVRQALQWGGLHGFEVLEINQRVQYPRCPSCRKAVKTISCPSCRESFSPQLLSQNTPGAPDTFWTHRDFGGNWWKGIEAKRDERAPVREEQKRLVQLGYVDLAWSLEMFEAALKRR